MRLGKWWGRSETRPALTPTDATLEAHREAARTTLERVQAAMEELTLQPPAPLRRAPAVALEAIRAEAEAVTNGTEPADRRRGPGRRASDYRSW